MIKQQVQSPRRPRLLSSSKRQLKNNKKSAILRLPSVAIKNNMSKSNHPNYVLGDLIGQGAFAKVRKATRKTDGLECVVKMYDKFRINTEQRKKAIKNQLQILKSIDNQFIIQYLDYYQNTDTINIVMKCFSNQSLSVYARQFQPLSIQKIKSITMQLTSAIVYLHQIGIAHRDLKPQNVLIKQQNGELKIKIIDFGLAMLGNQTQIKIAGTPQFMPPELSIKDVNVNSTYNPYQADIWSLGMMIYWIAMGYFPPKKKHLCFPVDIHPGLQYLLTKMLKQDPSDRITSEQILEDTWIKPKDLRAEIKRLSKNLGPSFLKEHA